MKKPDSLIELLEELDGEALTSSVETTKDSRVVVYLNQQAANAEDGISLNRGEAMMLLAEEAIVERFYEALGSPAEASVTLCAITVPDDSLDALERLFAAVDEG